FVVDRVTYKAKSQIVKKEKSLRRDQKGGLRSVPVKEADQNRSSLSDGEIREISEMMLKLEGAFGAPQDCEWAFSGGRLSMLQSRPITSLPPQAFYDSKVHGDRPILWDNSNIIESYSGVTSPLTFSHVSRAYRQVYLQFCELMGVPPQVVVEHEPM